MINITVDNKVIGQADKDKKIFYKRVNPKIHLFKKTDSWGCDLGLLKKLAEKEYTIDVYDGIKHYVITASEWLEKGHQADYGFGEQSFLQRQLFKNGNK